MNVNFQKMTYDQVISFYTNRILELYHEKNLLPVLNTWREFDAMTESLKETLNWGENHHALVDAMWCDVEANLKNVELK